MQYIYDMSSTGQVSLSDSIMFNISVSSRVSFHPLQHFSTSEHEDYIWMAVDTTSGKRNCMQKLYKNTIRCTNMILIYIKNTVLNSNNIYGVITGSKQLGSVDKNYIDEETLYQETKVNRLP